MKFVPVLLAAISLSASFQAAGQGAIHADTIPLAVFKDGAAVDPTTVQVDGQEAKVWQASPANDALTLKPAGASVAASSGALYLQVTYLDRGYGRLNVAYLGGDGQMKKPDKFTQAVLSDSGKWMTSLQRLNDVADSGTPDIQIRLEGNRDNALMVAQASLQNTPFTDSHFQYLLAEDWKRPYAGPSAPGIDNSTLKGKVMVGYQGWFRTPNDPYGHGWIHWGDMNRGQFTTDMWPDVSAYPADTLDKAADIKTLSGKPAYLFSSAWPEIEQTHFRWMRENQIDGAFVQRFLGGLYAVNGEP
jgi:hypothetical protein